MIDLHLHTNHSDGTDTVAELLENAGKQQLEIISITDHDTVGAYYEIEKRPELLNRFTGQLLVGVELKAIYNKTNIEILGYGFDYKKLKIRVPDKEKMQNEILQHFIAIGKKIGLVFDENIKIEINNPEKYFAGTTFANEILKHKENIDIIERISKNFTVDSFYRKHESNIDSPFYYDASKYYPNIKEVIENIHEAGGLAFLAHGFEYPFNNPEKEIENILKTKNIDGLECEHSSFTKEQIIFMKDLCKKYNKYMSGGTDYHAKNKPDVKIGTGINNNMKINIELIQDWIMNNNIKRGEIYDNN